MSATEPTQGATETTEAPTTTTAVAPVEGAGALKKVPAKRTAAAPGAPKRAAYIETESTDTFEQALKAEGYKVVEDFGAQADPNEAESQDINVLIFQHEKNLSMKVLVSRGNQHFLFNQTNIGAFGAGLAATAVFKSRNPKLIASAEAPDTSQSDTAQPDTAATAPAGSASNTDTTGAQQEVEEGAQTEVSPE